MTFLVHAIWKSYIQKILIFMSCLFVYIVYASFHTSGRSDSAVYDHNVLIYNQTFYRQKKTVKFLLWTEFFAYTKRYISDMETTFKESSSECLVTGDRNDIESTDVILFHLADLKFWKSLPKYRTQNQIWILFTLEPPPMIFSGNLSVPSMVFNWTMSYRRDSTVISPYGKFTKLTTKEIDQNKNLSFSVFIQKTKMAFSLISNCYDDARRYLDIKKIKKYIDVDEFGRCGSGRLNCNEKTLECQKMFRKYRFKLAFENSHCRDYVTEKYWESLQYDVIPIVNWKPNQVIDVPKNSYINIYDFKGMKNLADYLIKLSKNSTLYDSYFQWKRRFKQSFHYPSICEQVAQKSQCYQSQVIVSPWAWIDNDTCKRH